MDPLPYPNSLPYQTQQMLHVCSTHSLITGCDFIVLTLSDVNVGAEALSA